MKSKALKNKKSCATGRIKFAYLNFKIFNNTWFYFAFVYYGTNAKIYRNGVLVVNVAATFNTVNLNDIFRLGRGTDNVSQFNGAIDELKIYDYALTDGQVSNLFNFDAIERQDATLSPKLELMIDDSEKRGFNLYLPLFKSTSTTFTVTAFPSIL